jgi:hypothetical protein
VDWSKVPASAYPRTVKHLGLDADWFPRQGRLLSTDGVRLITVKMRLPEAPGEGKAAAIRLTRTYLGPNVHP